MKTNKPFDEIELTFGGNLIRFIKNKKIFALKLKDKKNKLKLKLYRKTKFTIYGFDRFEIEPELMEEKLDECRMNPNTEIGSHIYYVNNSILTNNGEEEDTVPILPTGLLYIEFNNKTLEADWQSIYDEFHLEIIESKGENKFLAKTTKKSPNPLKVGCSI